MLCSKQEKVSKSNNSVISLIRVMDLVHCTALPHVLSICEVSFQISVEDKKLSSGQSVNENNNKGQ